MPGKNRQSGSQMREEAQSPLSSKEEGTTHSSRSNEWENHATNGGQGRTQPLTSTLNEPDLGMTIRRLRESRQLTLNEIAARSGLTRSFLSQVERNLTSPSVASLRKVAQAFGVPLTELFQGPVMPENRVVRRDERRQLIHPSRQWRDYLLTPRLEFWVGTDRYVLEEGDSIVFESRIPHRNRNPGPEQAEVLWITTPPSY